MNALAGPLNLALFDLDNTLLAGDSDFEWAQFLIAKGVLDAELHAAMNDMFFQQYKEGTLDILFQRPNPDAIFCYKEEEDDDCLRGFSYITIRVSNGQEGDKEVTRDIKVWRTGQIGVNQ